MAGRTSTDLRRVSALLLAGFFVAAGCGSATDQVTHTSTATQAASTSTTPGSQVTGSGSTPSGDGGPSGIAGQAIAVICGGPSSEQRCLHRPVLATIDVLTMPPQRRTATVRTDDRGHFRIDLPPGAYDL
jgi:hypothetical protein